MFFGLVLGKGGALPMLLLPIRLGFGGRLGSGRKWLPWIHVEDVVPTPGWPMRLALGRQAGLLLEGQRVAPTRLEREGFVFRYPGLAQALQSLK
jgi:NAD dependent epimerase/dehydratase family enzyme